MKQHTNTAGFLYTLTGQDIEWCRCEAERRGIPQDKWRSTNLWGPVTTSVETHYAGLLGEIAVSRVLHTRINTTFSNRMDGDFWLGKWSGEVKYRGRRGYDFVLYKTDYLPTDIGVLAWPGPRRDTISLVGFTTKKHFYEYSRAVNFGYGDHCAVSWRDLMDIQRLIDFSSGMSK